MAYESVVGQSGDWFHLPTEMYNKYCEQKINLYLCWIDPVQISQNSFYFGHRLFWQWLVIAFQTLIK